MSSLIANPFGLKKHTTPKVQLTTKEQKPSIIYRGYIIFEEERYAFIKNHEQELHVQEGDRLGSVEIIKITPTTLTYQFQDQKITIQNINNAPSK